MGQVFAAVNEHIGQEVAIKVIGSPHADPALRARLLQEGRALAKLDHPGIVRVLTCDQTPQGVVYLVMGLLRGTSLRQALLAQPGPWPWHRVVVLGNQLAAALAAAHARGVYHRDLTPANIMLVAPLGDGDPIAKVLDFGLAKVATPPLGEHTQVETGEGEVLGTLGYAAPEQLGAAAQAGEAADVYGLGVVLYECLAGAPPFSGKLVTLATASLMSPPPPLRSRVRGVPAWLCRLIEAMIRKDPLQRPTMAEVFAALQRRRRRPVLLALAFVVCCALGLLAPRCGPPRPPTLGDAQAELLLRQFLVNVDRWLTTADWSMAQLPNTLDERRRVLADFDATLAGLPAAVRARGDVLRKVVEVRHRIGDLSLYHGPLATASADYQAAEQLLATALAAAPGEQALVLLQALNDSKRGKVAAARCDLAVAAERFQRSVDRLRTTFGNDPVDEEVRRVLSVSLQELGELRFAQGDAAAVTALRDAAALLAQSADDDDGWLRVEAARWLARALPPGDEALAVLRRALAEQTERMQRAPANLMYRATAARVHGGLAALHRAAGRLADAEVAQREALRLAREVQAAAPTDKRYALLRCEALAGAAQLALRQKSDAEVWQHREECRQLVDAFALRDPEDCRFARALSGFPRPQ